MNRRETKAKVEAAYRAHLISKADHDLRMERIDSAQSEGDLASVVLDLDVRYGSALPTAAPTAVPRSLPKIPNIPKVPNVVRPKGLKIGVLPVLLFLMICGGGVVSCMSSLVTTFSSGEDGSTSEVFEEPFPEDEVDIETWDPRTAVGLEDAIGRLDGERGSTEASVVIAREDGLIVIGDDGTWQVSDSEVRALAGTGSPGLEPVDLVDIDPDWWEGLNPDGSTTTYYEFHVESGTPVVTVHADGDTAPVLQRFVLNSGSIE